MPYHSTTPEVLAARLIGRADSRDPGTTCRGITVSSGKPCRRSIASKAPKGTKASTSTDGDHINPAEEFFCWQHKDQAEDTIVLHRSDSQKLRRLQGRSSLDTLVEVILGVEGGGEDTTANGGSSGAGGSSDGRRPGIGPDQAEVIIRRETLLNDDEVMVVRKKSVVKKNSKILKDAKRRDEAKHAVWEELHGKKQRPGRVGTAQSMGLGMGVIEEAPGDTYPANNEFKQQQKPRPRPQRHRQRPSLLEQLFCCITDYDQEPSYTKPARPSGHSGGYEKSRPRPHNQPPNNAYSAPPPMQFQRPVQQPTRPAEAHIKFGNQPRPVHPPQHQPYSNGYAKPAKPAADPELSSSSDVDSDDESDGASTICIPNVQSITPALPSHLSARTRTLITAELRKPLSLKDAPGYIYIFLLKDEQSAPPAPDANLAPSAYKGGSNGDRRRKNSYSKDPDSAALYRAVDDDDDEDEGSTNKQTNKNGKKTVLLKIGRAQNVQRRLHQWSQQCGYNLHLLRYYPYVSLSDQSPSPSPAGQPRRSSKDRRNSADNNNGSPSPTPGKKVPYANRVERLIHLELRDEYYNKPHTCETCQRVHKEWFAVPGNKDGVKRVDEVIKRWCKWGEDVLQLSDGGVDGLNTENANANAAVNRRVAGNSHNAAWSVRVVDDGAGGTANREKDARRVTGGVRGTMPKYPQGQQQQQYQSQQRQQGQYMPYRPPLSAPQMQYQPAGIRHQPQAYRPMKTYEPEGSDHYDRYDSGRRRDRYQR